MAEGSRRRSIAQIVVGFSADNSLALLDDDRNFYGSEDDLSKCSDESEHEGDVGQPQHSDDEENLDESPPAPADEPLAASGPGKRKHSSHDTTPSRLEEVVARVETGCDCREVNCFKCVSPDTLLVLRNTCEALTSEERFVLLAGKLDVLSRRGATRHRGPGEQAAERTRVTYR